MEQDITANQGITIGLDVRDRFSETYAIDDKGEWIESLRLPTTPEGLGKGRSRNSGARLVLEVGGHSPWISQQLQV